MVPCSRGELGRVAHARVCAKDDDTREEDAHQVLHTSNLRGGLTGLQSGARVFADPASASIPC
eukprot:6649686-Alexandrium_andersonii.AAC.1